VNAKGKIVEKFYIKVGTLSISSITSSLQITPSWNTNFTNSTIQKLDNSLEISNGSRESQLDAQLKMIKEKLNSVVNEKEEEIIQKIISSLSTLKREEKIPLIGLLASSFESFNDFTKLFPNSIISMHQWKKAIEHNVKDGKSYKPSKKLIQTKSEREIVDLVDFIWDHVEKVSWGTKKLSFDTLGNLINHTRVFIQFLC
jgi:hypothetical protein